VDLTPETGVIVLDNNEVQYNTMKSYSQTLRKYSFRHEIGGGILIALICVTTLFGCGGGDTVNNISQATSAALNIQVNPASTTVVVSGPDSYSQTFTGNQILTDLTPGEYTANATAPGFIASDASINVVEAHTSNLAFVLEATSILSEVPHAVYRDDQGNLIPLDATSLQSGEFVFYAWLQDESFGILPENLTATTVSDPLEPLLTEQTETAPSLTQNLAGAWVGIRDSSGVIRPVIGADVRWEIDQQYDGRIGSMQFGTSDDNRIANATGSLMTKPTRVPTIPILRPSVSRLSQPITRCSTRPASDHPLSTASPG
jgi:hypothetical protein